MPPLLRDKVRSHMVDYSNLETFSNKGIGYESFTKITEQLRCSCLSNNGHRLFSFYSPKVQITRPYFEGVRQSIRLQRSDVPKSLDNLHNVEGFKTGRIANPRHMLLVATKAAAPKASSQADTPQSSPLAANPPWVACHALPGSYHRIRDSRVESGNIQIPLVVMGQALIPARRTHSLFEMQHQTVLKAGIVHRQPAG